MLEFMVKRSTCALFVVGISFRIPRSEEVQIDFECCRQLDENWTLKPNA